MIPQNAHTVHIVHYKSDSKWCVHLSRSLFDIPIITGHRLGQVTRDVMIPGASARIESRELVAPNPGSLYVSNNTPNRNKLR